jgi:hypothetical protein
MTSSGTTGNFTTYNGSSSSTLSASSAITLDQPQMYEVTLTAPGSPTTGKILVNGVEKASGTLNNLNDVTRTINKLGTNNNASSNFYQGTLAEVLVYNRLLSDSQKAQVEAYLSRKYQLSYITPPAPVFNLATASLSQPAQITLSAPYGMTIYYTTDGSTPTSGSTAYTGPINVYYTQTIKAITIHDGFTSSVGSETYTLNSTNWPAPDAGDMTPLDIKLSLPTPAVPQ